MADPRIVAMAQRAITRTVVAETQPGGAVLAMYEDGTVQGYASNRAAVAAIRKRDKREAERTGNLVLTVIDWR